MTFLGVEDLFYSFNIGLLKGNKDDLRLSFFMTNEKFHFLNCQSHELIQRFTVFFSHFSFILYS